MNAVDFRNAAWLEIQERLSGAREEVYRALLIFGPCTTVELANRSGMSILSVRPRVTELCQMGLACLAERQTACRAGCYEALPLDEARRNREYLFKGEAQLALRLEV